MSVPGSSPRNSLELSSGSSGSVSENDKTGNNVSKGGEKQDVILDIGKPLGKHDVGATTTTTTTTTTTNDSSDNPDYNVYSARLQTIKSNIEPMRDLQGNVVGGGIFQVKQQWLDEQTANPRRDHQLVLDTLAAASTLTNAALANATATTTTTTTTATTTAANANPAPANPPGGLAGALAGLQNCLPNLPSRQRVVCAVVGAGLALGTVALASQVPAIHDSTPLANVTSAYNETVFHDVIREEWKVVNYSRGGWEGILRIPESISLADALERQWNDWNHSWVFTDVLGTFLMSDSAPGGYRYSLGSTENGTANISHFVATVANTTELVINSTVRLFRDQPELLGALCISEGLVFGCLVAGTFCIYRRLT